MIKGVKIMILSEGVLGTQNVIKNITRSINNFSMFQKLEEQFQAILFSELLNTNQNPLIEDKRNNNCDISIGNIVIELKYQFEFDILKMLQFYEKETYEKLAKSIERDIENSSEFVMFILERNMKYFNKEKCIFKEEGIAFHNNNNCAIKICEEYLVKLKDKYSGSKDIIFTKNYIVSSEKWRLHLVCATDRNEISTI